MADFTVRTLTESQWKEKWYGDITFKESPVDLHDHHFAGFVVIGAFRLRFYVCDERLKLVCAWDAETRHNWVEDDKDDWKPALAALIELWKADKNKLPRPSGLLLAKR